MPSNLKQSQKDLTAEWHDCWLELGFSWCGSKSLKDDNTIVIVASSAFPEAQKGTITEEYTTNIKEYWRWSIGLPGDNRLLNDDELREMGLLVDVDGETYHLIHAPDFELKRDLETGAGHLLSLMITARSWVASELDPLPKNAADIRRALQLQGSWLSTELIQFLISKHECPFDMSWAYIEEIDLPKSESILSTFAPLATYNALIGRADFEGALFNGSQIFSFVTFSGAANFNKAKFNGENLFWNATFSGDVSFNNATFNENGADLFTNVTFNGNASFDNAIFNVEAPFIDWFYGAAFIGDASFRNASFNGHARFCDAKFNGDAHFTDAEFNGGADFYYVTFSGATNFDKASFIEDSDFQSTNFDQANFAAATFNQAYFAEVSFSKDANFFGATFNGLAYFNRATFNGGANFRLVTFSGRTVFSNINWPYEKYKTVSFNGARLCGREATFESEYFNHFEAFNKEALTEIPRFHFWSQQQDKSLQIKAFKSIWLRANEEIKQAKFRRTKRRHIRIRRW